MPRNDTLKAKTTKTPFGLIFTNLYIKQAGTKETTQKLLKAILKCMCSRIYLSYSDKIFFKHTRFGFEEDPVQFTYLNTDLKDCFDPPIDNL